MKLKIMVAVALLLIAASAWAERPGNFRVIGPGGGGAMFHPTISPHDSNTVLIACDMSGSYITHDGGGSWRMFNLRGVVDFFVFDPKDPKVMYAHATGLWRSRDGGEKWELVYPSPSAVKGVRMNSDHSDEKILAEPDPLGDIAAMAIDPANPRVFYVAAGSRDSAGLFTSRDAGESWQKVAALPDFPRHIWIDPRSSREARTLYVASLKNLATVRGAARGTARGTTVDKVELPKEASDISLGFSADGPVVYVTSKDGLYISRNISRDTSHDTSRDGGKTWQQAKLPGDGGHVRAVAASLEHPEIAYVSYNRLGLDGKKTGAMKKKEKELAVTWVRLRRMCGTRGLRRASVLPGVKILLR